MASQWTRKVKWRSQLEKRSGPTVDLSPSKWIMRGSQRESAHLNGGGEERGSVLRGKGKEKVRRRKTGLYKGAVASIRHLHSRSFSENSTAREATGVSLSGGARTREKGVSILLLLLSEGRSTSLTFLFLISQLSPMSHSEITKGEK